MVTGQWTIVNDSAALDRALSMAKGTYQRNLLLGIESLSGSSLKGSARNWADKYKASRRNLLRRLHKAGIPVREERGCHNKRILVIG